MKIKPMWSRKQPAMKTKGRKSVIIKQDWKAEIKQNSEHQKAQSISIL